MENYNKLKKKLIVVTEKMIESRNVYFFEIFFILD